MPLFKGLLLYSNSWQHCVYLLLQVVDHLLAVDQMVERKYAPVLVEEALHKHKNDVVKVRWLASIILFRLKFYKLYIIMIFYIVNSETPQ